MSRFVIFLKRYLSLTIIEACKDTLNFEWIFSVFFATIFSNEELDFKV